MPPFEPDLILIQRQIDTAVASLAGAAIDAGVLVACAESCTGGMIAAALTDLAGSSAWFDRGFVTYSNEAKLQMLAVQLETLNSHGAVSGETACEMAQGALQASNAAVAVSVSGVAGPAGGSVHKPIGTVYVGVACNTGYIYSNRLKFDGNRAAVRAATVLAAVEALSSGVAVVQSETRSM